MFNLGLDVGIIGESFPRKRGVIEKAIALKFSRLGGRSFLVILIFKVNTNLLSRAKWGELD